MTTMILHVCDKCGNELRMADSGADDEWARWMTAEATLATDKVPDKDKGIFRFLWCKDCFGRIVQPDATQLHSKPL